jgi:hypothetical protein
MRFKKKYIYIYPTKSSFPFVVLNKNQYFTEDKMNSLIILSFDLNLRQL